MSMSPYLYLTLSNFTIPADRSARDHPLATVQTLQIIKPPSNQVFYLLYTDNIFTSMGTTS